MRWLLLLRVIIWFILLVVTNNGPSDAQNVMFTDVIPVLTGVTWSLNGVPMGGWTGFYNLGVMTPGQVYTLIFTGLVPASTPNGTVLNNTASVTSPTDPVEHNATAITNVKTQANLYIKKTGDAVVLPGGNINYTIFIKNNGPSDALNVHLYDGIDSLLTSAEYSLTGQAGSWQTWPPVNGYLNLNTIPAGGNVTVFIRAKILPSANRNINNTATVTSPTDPMAKKSTYISHLQSADLSITKKATPSKPYIHEKVKFTLIVQNHGPDTALDVYVADKLPLGLKYLSSSANYGQYNPITGIWTIGILPRGTIAVLNIIVGVEIVGPIQNHAHVYSSTYDPILNDTSATATIYVQSGKDNGNTIPMQNTGIPVIYMLIAGLLIGFGLIVPKKK